MTRSVMKSGSTLDARTRRAEREGFEPSIRVSTYAGLANRCLQPLGHLSGRVSEVIGARCVLQPSRFRRSTTIEMSLSRFRRSARDALRLQDGAGEISGARASIWTDALPEGGMFSSYARKVVTLVPLAGFVAVASSPLSVVEYRIP